MAHTHIFFFTIVRVILKDSLEASHVERCEEILHRHLFLLELDEEFLGVTAGLCARPRADMLLDSFPFFAVHFKRL